MPVGRLCGIMLARLLRPIPASNTLTVGDSSTLTDSAGNDFSIDASGNVVEDSVGGGGTSALASVSRQDRGPRRALATMGYLESVGIDSWCPSPRFCDRCWL